MTMTTTHATAVITTIGQRLTTITPIYSVINKGTTIFSTNSTMMWINAYG